MLLRFSLADCILKAPYDTVPVTLKDKNFVKKIVAHFIIHAELLSELTDYQLTVCMKEQCSNIIVL